jgi:hypothetical protein
MNKKLLTVALLTPLLYTACNSTTATPEPVKAEEKVSQVITKKAETTAPIVEEKIIVTETSTTGVNYVVNKPLIEEEGMLHIKSFMETLKPTLMNLMKEDKTYVTALGGCSTLAYQMTDDYSKLSDTVDIRRTALKYRNPANIPDKTDTTVMENMKSTKNFKQPLVVEMPSHYRVYKALDMKQPCLACHGDIENMSGELVKLIDKTYPKDLATGLKLGEFRGVVVAEIKK